MRRAAALIVIVVMCACAGWAQQAKADAAPVMQADRDFNSASQQKKLDGWMDYMADNVVLGHDDQPAFGKDAVRKQMAYLDAPNSSLTWQPTYGELFASGDIGFTTGTWLWKGKNQKGEDVQSTGRYLTVWKKQKDSSWKVVWDGGAADPKK
jgi:ketosteroid isomerase-like protein